MSRIYIEMDYLLHCILVGTILIILTNKMGTIIVEKLETEF